MKAKTLLALSFALILLNCNRMAQTDVISEPEAKKVPHRLEKHGDVRVDDYFWLNDRDNPEVIEYLNQENEYREFVMKGTDQLQEVLYDEMVGRIKKDDSSVPYQLDGWWYYTRFEGDQEYPIYCRKEGSLEAEEQILLDVNELARGHDYYQVGGLSVRPDKKMLAFGVDTLSRRIYTIHFKNLETGEILEEKIENTTGSATWAADNVTLFYARKNDTTLRSERILKHKLGTDATNDAEVFYEDDETFSTFVYKSKSKKYIIIGSSATLSDEYRFVSAATPDEPFQVFQLRERGLEYGISHFKDHWYIRTNKDDATNFKVMRTPETATTKENWEDVIPHREDVLVGGLELFKDHMVIEERTGGLTHMRIQRWDNGDTHYLDFGEETYTAYTGSNPDFNTDVLRYGYTSLTTPNSVIDYNMNTKVKTVQKEQEVVGGYDKTQYESKRIWAIAPDSTKIAVSLVYKKDLRTEYGNPTLLYGYGSYGYTIDPYFSSTRLSLLDRGFVYAIAHVRGSQYMGRGWYEDGKLLNKKNTFTDFIACGEHLIATGYANKQKLFAMGGSAGGLLMGAVVNMRPDLWAGIIAAVPFVDVMTTMLDESIPLTTGEYDEWGNPNEKEYYDYMLSYSPYDQVKKADYPPMLITTGLHDSQVQYWEPAKWIAKLRELRTNKSKPLLLYCNMETGHGGASGRFEAYKETAMEYAFLLDLMGISE
jgi:oligopeptidase B